MLKQIPYLHPVLIMVFFLVFTIMSLAGMFRLLKQRQLFGATVLLLSTLIFGFSTYVAYTL